MAEELGKLIVPKGPVAPASPGSGQVWFDTEANTYKSFNGTRWVALVPATTYGLPGLDCVPSELVGFGNFRPEPKRVYLVRFYVAEDRTITKMNLQVGTAGEATNKCELGIYNAALTERLAKTGELSEKLSATGPKELSLTSSLALRGGLVYYAGFVAETAATALRIAQVSFNYSALVGRFGTTAPNVLGCFQNTTFPLPASITTSGFTIGEYPHIWLT